MSAPDKPASLGLTGNLTRGFIRSPLTPLLMLTARFEVGTSSDAAILRVHARIRANMECIPVGIPEPLIIGRGIDDMGLTPNGLRCMA